MAITTITAEVQVISNAQGLDPITVMWINEEPGRGSVTITCYGCAWTCYFNAMSGDTIQQFFMTAGVDYLVNKLGITPYLKQKNKAYLRRIIEAIKAAIKFNGGLKPAEAPRVLTEKDYESVEKACAHPHLSEHGVCRTCGRNFRSSLCLHPRLNEDGICRTCGADRRA